MVARKVKVLTEVTQKAGPINTLQRHVSVLLFQVRDKEYPPIVHLTNILKQMGSITLDDCQQHTMKMRQEIVSF